MMLNPNSNVWSGGSRSVLSSQSSNMMKKSKSTKFSLGDDKENSQPDYEDENRRHHDKKADGGWWQKAAAGGRTKLGILSSNVFQGKSLDRYSDKVKAKAKDGKCQASSLSEITEEDASSMTKVVPKTQFPPSQEEDSSMDGSQVNMSPSGVNDFSINEFVSAVPKCDLFDDIPTMPPFFPAAMTMPMSPLPLTPTPMPPFYPLNYPLYLPPHFSPQPQQAPTMGVTATVTKEGFIRIDLNYNIVLDISNDMTLRLNNRTKESSATLSGSGKHCAIIHPKGRVLIYEPRVEIQTEDALSVKNAKVYPRGISFTANNMALVYLLDEAGARSTSDMFHDLYATNIVDTLFEEACVLGKTDIQQSIEQLDAAQYWRTESQTECWIFDSIFIQQTLDGLVIVERTLSNGAKISLKSSPSNGKIRLDSNFVQVTASLGDESHMFLRSRDRRLHYNGNNSVFMVRNAGHSAGFDEEGELRIF